MEDFLIKLKAIADENRLGLLKLLLSKNFCVRALANRLNISESAVSQHLKVLREADLVIGEKKGYFVHYQVKKENLLAIAKYIEEFIDVNKCEKEMHSSIDCNKELIGDAKGN